MALAQAPELALCMPSNSPLGAHRFQLPHARMRLRVTTCVKPSPTSRHLTLIESTDLELH